MRWKKGHTITVIIILVVTGLVVGITAYTRHCKKSDTVQDAPTSSAAGSSNTEDTVSIPNSLSPDEQEEAQNSAEQVEKAFTFNELELQNELVRYGLTEAVLNENSFPRNSGGEGLTTGFSFTDKGNGTYVFDSDKVKEEFMAETLNPTFVSARLQCLFEKGDPIVKYLDKTKEFTEKLKTEPMSHWLKKDEAGNIQYRKNDQGENEMFLNEEYLRGALAVCYLNDDGFSFSTEYRVSTVQTPDAVITWRKNIVNDNFSFDNDLKPVRDGNYKEAHKWASFLTVRQVLKNGKIISEENFDLYDKAPCIFIIKEKPITTTNGTSGGGKGDYTPTQQQKTTQRTATPTTNTQKTEPQPEKTTKLTTVPTTKKPEPTTKKPEPTTKKPEPTTKKPEPTTKKTNPLKDKSKEGNAKKGGGANLITDLEGIFQELNPEKSTGGPIYVSPTQQPKPSNTTKSANQATTAPVAVPTHVNESNYKDNKGNDVKINDDTVFDGRVAMPD